MTTPLQDQLAEATRLTRAGDLTAAMRVLQSAFSGSPTAPETVAPATEPARPAAFADVIDVEARVVPDATGSSTPSKRAESFVDGLYTDAHGAHAFKLFVPAAPVGQALPLIVMLHGCTQDADDFARGTAMNALAGAEACYVLYPQQSQQANPQRCWNWFKHSHQQRGRGEPAMLAGMTLDVIRNHAVDRTRIYVAGLSAGGAMAAVLGQTYPDVFAAVGVHSGLPAGVAADLGSALSMMQTGQPNAMASQALPAGALGGLRRKAAQPAGRGDAAAGSPPTIVFHGDADSTVHNANGEQVVAACVAAAPGEARVAVERNRAPGGHAYTRTVHRQADGSTRAEHWVIHGAGHAWAGGDARGSYADAQGPDASAEMLRFFLAHRLPVGAG